MPTPPAESMRTDSPVTEVSIPAHRLRAQRIVSPAGREGPTAPRVVSELIALQAQDLAASRWALGLRLGEHATEGLVQDALADGLLLRTHIMRGTWQLVTPADVRWLVDLVAPRLISMSEKRDARRGFDAALFRRSRSALERSLSGGRHATREEVAEVLARSRIAVSGTVLSHVIQRAELQGVICSGRPRDGKETFALLEERAPSARPPLPREEALAELALRYFRSRGPATPADFAWWAGLTAKEARAGLAEVRTSLISETRDGKTVWFAEDVAPPRSAASPRPEQIHLLPAFDEYLVSYKDRGAVVAPKLVKQVNAGGGMLRPCILANGRVVGTWRRTLKRRSVEVALTTFEPFSPTRRKAVAVAAERYGRFLERDVDIAF